MMAQLALRLLGQFQVQIDDQPVVGFKTDKARALLAYLAVEAGQPYQRVHLAGLLWPEWPEAAARTYVRQALANLRQVLGDERAACPFLLATRHTIQLNPTSAVWLDVSELTQALALLPRLNRQQADPAHIAHLQAAVALYRGRLLEGFFLDDCPTFEEWQLLTGEQLQRQVVEALQLLCRWYEAQGELAPARQCAQRCVEIEPLLDEAHYQLLRLLALTGEAGLALAHYEQYCRLLADELDAPPPTRTAALVAQIKAGRLTATGPVTSASTGVAPVLPPFLAFAPRPSSTPPFVAREAELAQLDRALLAAHAGQGNVLFVTGDAGRGKTALLRAFAHRAMQAHKELVVVGGSCSSREGRGDPFLPFRTILAHLTGDLEAPWTAGLLDREHALRLWSIFPVTIAALLHHGPDLVGTLAPIPALRTRLALLPDAAAWQAQVERLAAAANPADNRQPRALFDHLTKVLQALARHAPLCLWLDDLHWADRDSLALLFHLGRQLDGWRILVVGAYRPEEVSGAGPAQHPLADIVQELQRRSGLQPVDLQQAADRAFVERYLDTEPNRLDAAFRARLYQVSGGHPLFTVELLRTMRERGDLTRDDAGYWVTGATLDWETLPVRVSAVIRQRIERLPADLHTLLTVASVQGEQFSAQVLALVLNQPAAAINQTLGDALDRRHHLVVAEGIRRCGSQRLAQYRFRHALFQKYLLESLNAVERSQRHEAVARALEAIYQEEPDELAAIAGQLAWHYTVADLPTQAIPYHLLAGQWALRLSAYQEALAHFRQGLALFDAGVTASPQLQLELLTELAKVQAIIHGASSREVGATLAQADQVAPGLQATSPLFQMTLSQWEHHFQRAEFRLAQPLATACLRIAEQLQDPFWFAEANNALGSTLYHLGRMAEAQRHLARACEFSDMARRSGLPHVRGVAPGVSDRVNEAIPLWYLGYPDQARRRIADALALAEADGNLFRLVFALVFAAGIYQRINDAATTLVYAERCARLGAEQHFALWGAVGDFFYGWAQVAQGHHRTGLARMQQSLDNIHKTDFRFMRYEVALADAYLRCAQPVAALTLLEQLLATIAVTDDREAEAEVYRLQGAALLLHNPRLVHGAEAAFRQAIAIARRQEARSLELRATVSLSRLLQRQGRGTEALALLSAIYGWFTEGFDTPDLQAAAALLAAWAKPDSSF